MDDFLFSDYLIKEAQMTTISTIQKENKDALVMETHVDYEIYQQDSILILKFDIGVDQCHQLILKGCFKVEFTYHTSSLNQRELVRKAVDLCNEDVFNLVTHYMELLIKDKKEVN